LLLIYNNKELISHKRYKMGPQFILNIDRVYSRFPDGHFPDRTFPGKTIPGYGHFPRKTFPGWSFSRMRQFLMINLQVHT